MAAAKLITDVLLSRWVEVDLVTTAKTQGVGPGVFSLDFQSRDLRWHRALVSKAQLGSIVEQACQHLAWCDEMEAALKLAKEPATKAAALEVARG